MILQGFAYFRKEAVSGHTVEGNLLFHNFVKKNIIDAEIRLVTVQFDYRDLPIIRIKTDFLAAPAAGGNRKTAFREYPFPNELDYQGAYGTRGKPGFPCQGYARGAGTFNNRMEEQTAVVKLHVLESRFDHIPILISNSEIRIP
jgi:hypothetical protein